MKSKGAKGWLSNGEKYGAVRFSGEICHFFHSGGKPTSNLMIEVLHTG
jgi:hypothetical protein